MLDDSATEEQSTVSNAQNSSNSFRKLSGIVGKGSFGKGSFNRGGSNTMLGQSQDVASASSLTMQTGDQYQQNNPTNMSGKKNSRQSSSRRSKLSSSRKRAAALRRSIRKDDDSSHYESIVDSQQQKQHQSKPKFPDLLNKQLIMTQDTCAAEDEYE